METTGKTLGVLVSLKCPHSLGILIEWKPSGKLVSVKAIISPHLLGILIEWKHLGKLLKASFDESNNLK